MKNIIIFSGTTEGRTLSRLLADNKVAHFVSVATDYGEKLCVKSPYVTVKKGRMDVDAIEKFFVDNSIDIVIDATHPYAKEVTKNIKEAAGKNNIKYMRYVRSVKEDTHLSENENIKYFDTVEECVNALHSVDGNIMLTSGSKELSYFCKDEKIKSRLIARVLPGAESIDICEKNGLLGRQIIAMQGPFSYDMNLIMLKQFNIACLVTKQSGRVGGFEDKYYAAQDAGISLYVIGRPDVEEGNSIDEIYNEIGIDNLTYEAKKIKMDIKLIGCGMGAKSQLTDYARECIESADIILGSERLIAPYTAYIEKKPYYLASDIIPYLEKISLSDYTDNTKNIENHSCRDVLKVSVLFSGDTGFYSGADKLFKALLNAVNDNRINADLEILPGISSISYLASKIHVTWDDAKIISIHGRKDVEVWKSEIYESVSTHKKTFLIISNLQDLKNIMSELKEKKMEACVVYAGYRLSYEDEKIITLKSGDDLDCLKEGLYTCLIVNPDPVKTELNIYLKDEEFRRGKVPMTKEEVRCLSIAKLDLSTSSVVYDVGSGTGSIAVQIARLSKGIKVYAIEKNPEAVNLIKNNCKLFETVNVSIYEGEAPYIFEKLPMPTHAFIGGSNGKLMEILKSLYEKNPHMRIVINAVSTETIRECMEIEKNFKITDFSMIQLGVTRINKLREHHMLKAENPIWICSFSFCE